MDTLFSGKHVLIIGAGPAGLFAAKQLANDGASVTIINEDLRPGGFAEYGIYPDKIKIKEGMRSQFRAILAMPQVRYLGGVKVGLTRHITLDQLRGLGFQAVLVTTGAQCPKWLGLPGENLRGVYHASEIVCAYNRRPFPCPRPVEIGRRVALIGAGNVMLDMARWLAEEVQVDELTALVRRGPAEVKFDKDELRLMAPYVDLPALDAEVARVAPLMQSLGQDSAHLPALARSLQGQPARSNTRLRLRFLVSPRSYVGDDTGRVRGIELEDNTLIKNGEDTKAAGLGTLRVFNCDTILLSIGDAVDPLLGLPVNGTEFALRSDPRFPIEGQSFEIAGMDEVFVAGWARRPSVGLVGMARKDGILATRAVNAWLNSLPAAAGADPYPALLAALQRTGAELLTREDVARLDAKEKEEALRRGLEVFQYLTYEEILAAARASA
ncbi:MAG TPA: FAD-dependent oxidoreductase [Anaerolineaceae bacterium]|nr:FAD-dependent oxidoreductase [Anaerolineaceae bacterium]HPN51195.1 FAD-dependent oxidoreductase [Anaerolineaceae bacterium]